MNESGNEHEENEQEDNQQEDNQQENTPPSRWQLLRDLFAFQFKLLLDGLRDLFLSPISIVAAIIGLLTSSDNPGRYFYRLLEIGHDSDRWINLFNTYSDDNKNRVSADHIVRKAESAVVSEYEKSGSLRAAKHHADKVIDKLQEESSKRRSNKPADQP